MIHWLLQSAAQCPEIADGVAPAGLLSAAEKERLAQLASPKRRSEWLLGRCTAKRLVQRYLEVETGQQPPLEYLVIARESDKNAAPIVVFDGQAVPLELPNGARWVSNAPLVAEPGRRRGLPVPRVSGMRLPISLSISHSNELALCALYAAGGKWQIADGKWQDDVVDDGFPIDGLVQIGVDIEGIAPLSDAFVRAYFAADEMHWIGQALGAEQALLTTVTWSAKEAVLKALRRGLTVDTRQVVCLPATGMELTGSAEYAWNEVHVQCSPSLLPEELQRTAERTSLRSWEIRGWWRRSGRCVLTAALFWQEAVP